MKRSEGKVQKLVGLLLIIAVFLLFSCSEHAQTVDSAKELKISYLGFNTSISNYFEPGKNVELVARANKKSVMYEWELPGEWEEIHENKVLWKVPEKEGSYRLSVSVTDKKTSRSVNKSIDVTVAENAVCAVPDSFSCKVTTNIMMKNRLVGENLQTTVSSIKMNSDDSVYVETIEADGEITRTYADSEAVYDIDSKGKRTLVARCSTEKSMMPSVDILSLSSLINACSDYETDGRFYKFRQSSPTQKVMVEYDSKLGVVTRVRSENEDNMEVNDMRMEYDVIDGYIIPKKISGSVTYYAQGEKFSTQIEEEISDVIINENGEE